MYMPDTLALVIALLFIFAGKIFFGVLSSFVLFLTFVFICSTDEYGTASENSALDAGLTPRQRMYIIGYHFHSN